ncbi:DoxX family protein [Pseudonocardia thermophila]|jgi:DoxX.|uniref:DoxX family protein n=1 Tax=Pseudonocardia thermophila TaxID=1848 RepID=UPI00248E8FD5|nr:DoxX family protein [Pseudonocardia thermophila]
MFIATAVVSVVLAALLLVSAHGKLTREPKQMQTLKNVGVPEDKVWLLATAEIAGAAGLLAGLFWWPVGAAAGIGVVLYFIGAVAAHLRVGDKRIAPAAIILVLAVAALAGRLLTS